MQACAIDFPRLIAWIALSPSRARAIPPNHSLLNRSTFQAGVERLPGQEDVRIYLVPSRNFPELPGFEAQIHVDVVMSQSIWYVSKVKMRISNFGSKRGHQP